MPCTVLESLEDFNVVLKEAGGKLVILDFHAVWCGPCKIISPVFEDLSGEYTDVVFCKVDVDDATDIAEKYKITCMPTFLFFKNGDQVGTITGASEAKLKQMIKQLQ